MQDVNWKYGGKKKRSYEYECSRDKQNERSWVLLQRARKKIRLKWWFV